MGKKGETHQEKSKEGDVRSANITAGKLLADIVRSSLGPRGADKMIVENKGEVLITNDGATILSKLSILHPCARMLVETSKAQDVEAGDGTTSVVVLAGSLLRAAESLLAKNIHPTVIAEAFMLAQKQAEQILQRAALPCEIDDRDKLIQAAITSLASKIISQNSAALAPIAVDAVKAVTKPATDRLPARVDLHDVKLVKVLGGTMDDTELVDGLVFEAKASKMGGGPTHISNAKIALIQFQLSPPKTDMENNVVVKTYDQMDRVLREEREYLLHACKTISQAGCNVLLIQKSILRDAVTDQSLHFLARMKVMVIRDIERTDIEFICKTLGCTPIASLESFKADKFGFAARAEEVRLSDTKVIKITGVSNPLTRTILVRGATQLVVDEAERSLHDAMCVVRCLIKKHFLIAGGGAPEAEASVHLLKYARTLEGVHSLCVRAYAEALQIIPYTLAENAGLPPIQVTTELHARHNEGHSTFGINVRKGTVTDMVPDVVQPLLVSLSAFALATETVVGILKIDDIVQTR